MSPVAIQTPQTPNLTLPTLDLTSALGNVQSTAEFLNKVIHERKQVIDSMMVAVIAREHMLLVGEPGVAKSYLVNVFSSLLNASLFEYLLTRFTEPSELFGEIDIAEFKTRAKRVRNTKGMLPDVEIAFLDEAYKANSAILNALLTILNERKFDNGGSRVDVPLHSAFLASNELPQDASLAALHDRILIRHKVSGMEEESNWEALCFDVPQTPTTPIVTLADFKRLHDYTSSVTFSAKAREACRGIRSRLIEKKVKISDRRWVKATKSILRAHAVYKGSSVVTEEHLDILRFVFWNKYEDIPVVEGIIEEFAAAWISAVRDMNARLDDAHGRLNNARGMTGGARFRAIADLTDMVGPMADEAKNLHGTFNRRETADLILRAKSVMDDALKLATGGR